MTAQKAGSMEGGHGEYKAVQSERSQQAGEEGGSEPQHHAVPQAARRLLPEEPEATVQEGSRALTQAPKSGNLPELSGAETAWDIPNPPHAANQCPQLRGQLNMERCRVRYFFFGTEICVLH